MDSTLTKSLTDLIDETLLELEELKKSRFAASEIKIEGPGDGIDGKPSDGDLHAKGENEAAKSDEDEDDKDEDDDMEKGDPKNDDPADSDEVKAKVKDLLGKDEDKDEDDEDEDEDEDEDDEDDKKEMKEMKKSLEESESLMKSYVEERVKPLEDKLSTILDLVNKIADQPVAPKGFSARGVTPLLKSGDVGAETLSKAQIADKLFELKKSGTKVDSNDIVKAEMGQDLQTLIKKYEIS